MTVPYPLRVRWVGHPAGSQAGRIDAACCAALKKLTDILLVTEGPADVLVVTDGLPHDVPARWCVHYPLLPETLGHMQPAWAASARHQAAFGPEAGWIPLPDPASPLLAHDLASWDWAGWTERVQRALQRLCRPPARVRLSACVVANGGLADLQRTLADVRGLVDEIVVVHDGDGEQADLAMQFGAVVVTADVGRQAEARGAAADVATGLWLLLLEAGETIIGGFEPLQQIRAVAPQGPDVGLIDLHDSLAGDCGSYLAPRVLARWPGLKWQGPAPEGLVRPTGGAVIVLPFGLKGVHRQPRPELRGGLAESGIALLRESLREAPGNPQAHYHLAVRFRARADLRQAARHYEAALAYSNLVGRWPLFAIEALEARCEIAMQLGHLELAANLLEMPPRDAVQRPEFWLIRAHLDWRVGQLEAAAGAVGKGWEVLGDRKDLPATRQHLARMAADLCVRQEQLAACANWLIEVVAERNLEPTTIAGWCRWLQLAGQWDGARRLAQAAGVAAWEMADAIEPLLDLGSESRPLVTVILVLPDGRTPLPGCLTAAARLGDEVIMVVPPHPDGADLGGPYGFRTLAVEGDLRDGVLAAGRMARGQWLFLLHGDEWADDVTVRLVHQSWLQVGLAQGLTVDVHPAVEAEGADAGQAEALRLVRPTVVAGLDGDGRNWLVGAGAVLRRCPGAIVWRDQGPDATSAAVRAIEPARSLLAAGDVEAAIIAAEAWVVEATADVWPSPGLWRGMEMLADLYRLQGDGAGVERCLRLLAELQPCLVRPGTGKRRAIPTAAPAAEWLAPDEALSIVDAIRSGRVDQAVREVDAWVTQRPEAPAAWGFAARVHLEAANLSAAEAALRRCLLLRAVRPAVPVWFPDLHGVPEGLLGRCFLARGEARRALDWLLPMLAKYSADVELSLFTIVAAWLCGETQTVAAVVGWLAEMTPIEEGADLDAALGGAATEFGWPARSLPEWQEWIRTGGQSP